MGNRREARARLELGINNDQGKEGTEKCERLTVKSKRFMCNTRLNNFLEGFILIDILFLLTEIIFVTSYLFRDIFILRLISMAGSTGYIIGGLAIGYEVPGIRLIIVFNGISIIINSIQCLRIIIEKRPILLPDDLKKIYNALFYKMTTKEFMRVYQFSFKKKYKKGETLTIQDQPVKELIAINKGNVDIVKNGLIIRNLGEDFFIGEMSFLSHGLATAWGVTNSEKVSRY